MATATETRADGRAPAGPERLAAREWLAVFKRTFRRFLADDCMGLAQQVAYSSLLAFFPAVIFLVGLLDLINAYDTLLSFLTPATPKAVTDLIVQLRKDSGGSSSVVAVILGAAGALWAASGAAGTMMKAVNRAYECVETRPFWKQRLIAVGLVIASAIVVGGTLILTVFGGKLGAAIAAKANVGSAWSWIWNIFRWPIAFVAVLLLFALVYYLAPNKEQRSWKWITPGSLLGSTMWIVLSGLFALYTSISSSFSRTYGSLAGGIILLLWLNYTAWSVLFGAELNSELDREAEIRAADGPNAGLVKPARRVET